MVNPSNGYSALRLAHYATGDATDWDRLPELNPPVAPVGAAELVTVDHRDAQHQLDLLLERVEGLAGHGANRQRGAETRSDRGGPADHAGNLVRHA